MFYCPQCRAELIDGQVICMECGYDQRKSVGRPGMTKGTLALVIIMGILLVPAVVVTFCVACVGSAVLMMSGPGGGANGSIELAFFFGFLAAAVVLAAGSYLIYWLVNRRRHPSEWTDPAPLPPAEPGPLPTPREPS